MELTDVLTEVARSGKLGLFANGVALDAIFEAFGEPWDVGTGASWPRLFAYGDLELAVCRCQRVTLICLQTCRDVVELPVGLVDRQTFPGHPTYPDVIEALDRSGCAWQIYAPLTFDNQCAIQVVTSDVVFVFEISPGQDPVLNVVGFRHGRHDCFAVPQPAC